MNLALSICITVIILITGATLASATSVPSNQMNAKDMAEGEAPREPENKKAEPLSLTLTGIRNANGKLLVMVFDQESAYRSYDYNRAIAYQEVPAQVGSLKVDFSALTDGPYAIFVLHDENVDYELNEAAGYPTEGFATSGALSKYDEPAYAQAAVAKGDYHLAINYF